MIDLFSLGIAHALMMLAAWRLMRRPDLDLDDDDGPRAAWGQRTKSQQLAGEQAGNSPDA